MQERRTQAVEDRLAKIEELRRRGIEPYAYRYEVTHHTAAARSGFEEQERDGSLGEGGVGETVRIAGRLLSMRSHGKTVFADLADRDGRLQLFLRMNDLGDAFPLLELLDPGDWVGAEGTLFRTRTGEVSVRVSSFELLAKAVRPLPFGKEEVDAETGERRVHGGFGDVEQRYRQRYADLAVNPDVRAVFMARSRIVTAVRRFLDERGYLEVETPVLQPLYGGASARPFVDAPQRARHALYLRIADELYLKRLIVGGLERVYEIGKDFRNEGIDRTHNPEFTMLEFYEAFADYNDMMTLVESMIGGRRGRGAAATRGELPGRRRSISPPFAGCRSWTRCASTAASMSMRWTTPARGEAAALGVEDATSLCARSCSTSCSRNWSSRTWCNRCSSRTTRGSCRRWRSRSGANRASSSASS
jgi:lysyl-tRNA synthetase, class II